MDVHAKLVAVGSRDLEFLTGWRLSDQRSLVFAKLQKKMRHEKAPNMVVVVAMIVRLLSGARGTENSATSYHHGTQRRLDPYRRRRVHAGPVIHQRRRTQLKYGRPPGQYSASRPRGSCTSGYLE